MRLAINKAVIENFAAIVTRQSVLLDRPGLNLVRGRNLAEPRLGANGAGKSTIWCAVTWALYGRTLDGGRNPDIRSWHGKNKAYVGLQLRTDAKPYRLERSVNPNRLMLDGLPASQEQVDRLLGINFETFRNAVILGQGRPLFLDLEPSRKMALFADVLGLAKWDARSEQAKRAVQIMEGALASQRSREATIRASLSECSDQMKRAKRDSDLWEVERAKQLLAAGGDLKKLEKDHEKQTRQRIKYDLAYDGTMTELKSCEREITQLEALRRHAKEDCDKHELDRRIATAEAARLVERLAALAKRKGTCPTCGQPITHKTSNRHKEEIKDEIAHYKKVIQAGIPQAAISALSDLDAQLATARKAAEEFVAKADTARDRLDTYNKPLADLAARIEQIQKARRLKEHEANPFTEQIGALKRRARDLSDDLASTGEAIADQLVQIERAVIWIKGFKEIKLQIIEDVLQELEITTDAMLEEVGLVDWKILFDVERETTAGDTQRVLHAMIYSPRMEQPVKFQSFSGGEGQRLRIVGALALADVLLNRAGVQSTIEVLDEPSKSLSKEGINDLVEFLHDRANDRNKSIYYVDHNVVEGARFASIIRVEKDDKGVHIS